MSLSPKSPGEQDYARLLREMNDALLISSVRQHELTEQAQKAEAALRESEERLALELAATQRLQEISTQLIREDNAEALYDQILAAAVAILRADMASLQVLDTDKDALRLLAWRGFDLAFGKIFEFVGPYTKTSCSVARQLARRVIVPDVEKCDFIAGTPALESHRKAGIRAVQSTPLFSRGGQLLGMISTHWRGPHQPAEQELRLLDVLARQAADLIERARADEDLRKSEERFHTMADSSPMMIWTTDAEGCVSFLNRTYQEYFGSTARQEAVLDWSEAVHPDDREGYAGAFHRALQMRQVFHKRVRLRRHDSEWRWFESRGHPILAEDGSMTEFIVSSADITEIYQSQQALKELDRRKDEFLANMSHEIRSPLTGIMGYADILLTKAKDPEDIHCLNTIKECGDHLVEIVNDVLDLAKIEAGKLVLDIRSVSVHSILREVQNLMDVRAGQKKLPLSLRYEGPLPGSIRTDRTRLRQILINLVSNAIKFTERGRVEMVARLAGDESFEVEVIDTGIGIAPEHQQNLFRPFSQVDATSTREHGGTGLGLAITKRLVEMLGGAISCKSEPGRGSVFRVTLPVGSEEAAGSRKGSFFARGEVRPKDHSLENRRVLVVDDRNEICQLISHYIREAGGRAEAAPSGQSALAALEAAAASEPFDAMILDIHMPGMDGYQVARTLRARGYPTPIIAVTADAMIGDRDKCLEAGCDDYLTKPIDRQTLLELLARQVKRVRMGAH